MTTTIPTSECYALHVTARPVEALPGQVEVKIESTFTGAKNPDERQVKFHAVLGHAEAHALAFSIGQGAASAQDIEFNQLKNSGRLRWLEDQRALALQIQQGGV